MMNHNHNLAEVLDLRSAIGEWLTDYAWGAAISHLAVGVEWAPVLIPWNIAGNILTIQAYLYH